MSAPFLDQRIALAGGARARLYTWTTRRQRIPAAFDDAIQQPCIYLWHGLARLNDDQHRRSAVGYTGVSSRPDGRAMASLDGLRLFPDFELRAVGVLTVRGGRPRDLRSWLRVLEAELIADQALRRFQLQRQSAAPTAVRRLEAAGFSRGELERAARRALDREAEHERALGLRPAPWACRGTENLRDLAAVAAHHASKAGVGFLTLDELIALTIELFPNAADRDIEEARDSFGRDVRVRESQLLLSRYELDAGLVRPL